MATFLRVYHGDFTASVRGMPRRTPHMGSRQGEATALRALLRTFCEEEAGPPSEVTFGVHPGETAGEGVLHKVCALGVIMLHHEHSPSA